MSEFRRATRPMNEPAKLAANSEVPKVVSSDDRRAWMDAYVGAGGEVEWVQRKGSSRSVCQACSGRIRIGLENEVGGNYAGQPYEIWHATMLVAKGELDGSGYAEIMDGPEVTEYTVKFPKFEEVRESLTREFSQPIPDESKFAEERILEVSSTRLTTKELEETIVLALATGKTHRIRVPCKRTFAILVGTEQYYRSFALKMMFFAPAVRDVLSGEVNADGTTIYYFPDGYVPAEIDAVNSSLRGSYATLTPVHSSTELYANLNERTWKDPRSGNLHYHRIHRVHIYAHGIVGQIAFGYRGPDSSSQVLDANNIVSFDPARMTADGQFVSFACRTGIGIDGESFASDAEAKRGDSLAQKIANHLGVEVKAWMTRTLYQAIWNDGGDEEFQSQYVKIPHEGLEKEKYWFDARGWFSSDDDHALWNPRGAFGPIGGASTPSGISNSPQFYTKQ